MKIETERKTEDVQDPSIILKKDSLQERLLKKRINGCEIFLKLDTLLIVSAVKRNKKEDFFVASFQLLYMAKFVEMDERKLQSQ